MTPTVMRSAGPESCTVAREDCDPEAWDAFVAASPQASYAHLSAWHEVMTGALGLESVRLVARGADGVMEGVLPLAWVRSRFTGRYLVSMPQLNSGGPIGTSAARLALSHAAVVEAQRGRADLLELRSLHPCDALARSDRRITVQLPLAPSPDGLWQRFASKLRSQIRRPRNEGCTVRFGARERDAFHVVYQRHMRDLGSPGLGRSVFATIARVLSAHVEFGAVYDRTGNPVAAGCGFIWRGAFELVWAASLRSAQQFSPNMLLYWSFMERSIAMGATVFDFGRCAPGSGTHRFKRQWGGGDVPLPWQQWTSTNVSAPPKADSGRFRAAAAVWRRLPPLVTNACGPSLARMFP